jgi:hypothetical protein
MLVKRAIYSVLIFVLHVVWANAQVLAAIVWWKIVACCQVCPVAHGDCMQCKVCGIAGETFPR